MSNQKPSVLIDPSEIKQLGGVVDLPPEEKLAEVAQEELKGPAEDTEDLGDNQKSIILQLIKQLRVGMDLTKVLIPVDFLEPRSLLEKMTDFLTHSDIAVAAAEFDDPVQRMVHLTKWYLSGWHVKPKGVKKPYNPALGEIYRANWELPTGDTLTYFAEQVSHHPPISAIFGEVVSKEISFEGWYYPRSKFLGNSAASVAEGVVKLHMKKHKELYVCTWPDIYARGIIFGKIIMELGGKTNITCKQSGLVSEVEFKQKPFFGGEYHIVTAKIKKKGKTLYTISGKWNESYFIKSKDSTKDQLFFNTKTAPKLQKRVPYFDEQLPHESRKKWFALSTAIRNRDISLAAQEKFNVEEESRQQQKEREAKGIIYQPKFFKKGPEDFWNFIGHDTEEYKLCHTKLPMDGAKSMGPSNNTTATNSTTTTTATTTTTTGNNTIPVISSSPVTSRPVLLGTSPATSTNLS